ncbi:MAG: hypothetical protein ACP5JG_00290 [Anaerolineae bacterium]
MTDQDVIRERILNGLDHLENRIGQLQRANRSLLASGIISSAASTLATGATAANGPVVGSGTPGWRLACIVAAVFSFGATVAVGLNQRLKIGEKLAEGRQCTGHLRALEVAMATGSRPRDEIVKDYEELVRTYPDLVR